MLFSDVTLVVAPPFTLLTLRIVLALIVLYPLERARAHAAPPKGTKATLLGVGAVGLGVSLGTQFVGTDLSTAINGALVTSASPAFVVLFALVLLRERLTLLRLLSIVLASARRTGNSESGHRRFRLGYLRLAICLPRHLRSYLGAVFSNGAARNHASLAADADRDRLRLAWRTAGFHSCQRARIVAAPDRRD